MLIWVMWWIVSCLLCDFIVARVWVTLPVGLLYRCEIRAIGHLVSMISAAMPIIVVVWILRLAFPRLIDFV